jgi:acetyl esterase/lipase
MDAKSAFRWVQSNADKLGIDAKKIAAGGASAGGHLAAAIATVSEFNDHNETTAITAPVALILFNAVIDNSQNGYGFERVKPYWRAISPLHNITKGHPPTIFFLGTNDRFIPIATGEAYRDKITAVGSQAELIIYQDKKHGFFNRRRSEDVFKDTVLKAHDFLNNVKFLP